MERLEGGFQESRRVGRWICLGMRKNPAGWAAREEYQEEARSLVGRGRNTNNYKSRRCEARRKIKNKTCSSKFATWLHSPREKEVLNCDRNIDDASQSMTFKFLISSCLANTKGGKMKMSSESWNEIHDNSMYICSFISITE